MRWPHVEATRHKALLAVLAFGAELGCAEARHCRAERDRAQELVKSMDSKSIDSMKVVVSALTSAIDACEKAKLGTDKQQLIEAKNQIGAHLAHLERKAKRKKEKLSPEEIAKLEREGDPTCPKGQGYKQPGTREIKCTGPQLIDMNVDAANEYFTSRRYKITITDAPPRLRAEQGAELYVFTFDKPNDERGPKCLELYPIPGVTLPEAVGRATGARLEKLKSGGSVKAERGEMALFFEESDKKMVAKIGDCGAPAPAPAASP
jgi:hypothetical protein